MRYYNLGLFVSGELGFECLKMFYFNSEHKVSYIFTDNKSESIIKFGEDYSLSMFKGNPRNEKAFNFAKDFDVDFILSINYLFILNQNIIDLPRFFSFNIHGSLLPLYRGRTPHVWAIINGENFTGITAHKISVGCDEGDVIKQIKVPINQDTTGGDLLNEFGKLYYPLALSVLDSFSKSKIKLQSQDNGVATYFDKRTPDDGHINWNWFKHRIYNWVRAQSSPYPGSFSFYHGKKIIIDEVKFSNRGYNQAEQNGLILSLSPILIKTPNGVLEILKVRNIEIINDLRIGEILN